MRKRMPTVRTAHDEVLSGSGGPQGLLCSTALASAPCSASPRVTLSSPSRQLMRPVISVYLRDLLINAWARDGESRSALFTTSVNPGDEHQLIVGGTVMRVCEGRLVGNEPLTDLDLLVIKASMVGSVCFIGVNHI